MKPFLSLNLRWHYRSSRCVYVRASVSSAVSLPPCSGFTAVGLAGHSGAQSKLLMAVFPLSPLHFSLWPGNAVWSADVVVNLPIAHKKGSRQMQPGLTSQPLPAARSLLFQETSVQPH